MADKHRLTLTTALKETAGRPWVVGVVDGRKEVVALGYRRRDCRSWAHRLAGGGVWFDVREGATMATGTLKLGPADQGRAMTVAEFQASDFEEGFLYELSRGTLTVSDVPKPPHLRRVSYLRRELAAYEIVHPDFICAVGGGSDCRLVISQHDSVRHPDLAVYLTPAPTEDASVWEVWVPEFVVEVVSPGSEMRDRQEKRDECLAFGVREYWIVDAPAGEAVVLQRVGGRWRESRFQPGQMVRSLVLPGFECDCGKLLNA